MRAVIQRVTEAHVQVEGKTTGRIGRGLMVLLGVSIHDTPENAAALAGKIISLRIFDDDNGRMNICLKDVNGQVLVVSQFTLYGDCKKGRRPDFTMSAPAERARVLYQAFIEHLSLLSIPVETGVFGALMKVSLVNDGPVTIIMDI